jgi:PGAP1-like protein
MTQANHPIIYVRGYAGTQGDVEETVDDPLYGFNAGSTHIRLDQDGRADFFMFVSPFARLFKDFGYADVIEGALQQVDQTWPTPKKTIWIYRYYDPTSETFDRPGGRRLSIEETAEGLREFVTTVKDETKADKVYLVAHSMGGLVCRSLIQKIYPEHDESARDHIDKLFTYGTPHKGILFALGGGLVEKLRDALGVNDSNDFGPQRMYEYLTPGVVAGKKTPVPKDFDSTVIPDSAFDRERVFCIVGTDASDYSVAAGGSRMLVGPQSDGLVQIESAAVEGAHRAYIHRSHSGRYGMVNSEEGYQNLQRFLFGDVKVKAVLCNLDLNYKLDAGDQDGTEITYLFETQVAIRGLPILMHERTLNHYCADAFTEEKYKEQMSKGGLPLFTNFLLSSRARKEDGTMRYMLRLAVYKQKYKKNFLLLRDHLERLPLWSDYLIVGLTPSDTEEIRYKPSYSWASISQTPDQPMKIPEQNSNAEFDVFVPMPEGKAQAVLGSKAQVTFQTFDWS